MKIGTEARNTTIAENLSCRIDQSRGRRMNCRLDQSRGRRIPSIAGAHRSGQVRKES